MTYLLNLQSFSSYNADDYSFDYIINVVDTINNQMIIQFEASGYTVEVLLDMIQQVLLVRNKMQVQFESLEELYEDIVFDLVEDAEEIYASYSCTPEVIYKSLYKTTITNA